jgi:hypothetical protein
VTKFNRQKVFALGLGLFDLIDQRLNQMIRLNVLFIESSQFPKSNELSTA